MTAENWISLLISLAASLAAVAVTWGKFASALTRAEKDIERLQAENRELRAALERTAERQGERVGRVERWLERVSVKTAARGVPVTEHGEGDG